MPQHFSDFLEVHRYSPDMLLVKKRAPLAEVSETLLLIWAASQAVEWKNRILKIPAS
jgi:hypothetical protein